VKKNDRLILYTDGTEKELILKETITTVNLSPD